jgi:hypothetical protein
VADLLGHAFDLPVQRGEEVGDLGLFGEDFSGLDHF